MNKQTKPFFILSVLHIALLLYTFQKKKQITWLLLWNAIGFTYLFEYVVLNVFKMYRYKPDVFHNKWFDNILGAILSQSVFVPIKATFLILFRFNWYWKVAGASLFGLIERLFIYKGIYKNNTWQTSYTVTLIIFYFWFTQKWWEALIKNKSKMYPFMTIYFSYVINYVNVFYFIVVLSKAFLFRTGIVKDKYEDHFLIAPLYGLYVGMIGTVNTVLSSSIWSKLIGLTILHMSDRILVKLGILKLYRMNVYAFLPVHFVMMYIGEWTKSLLQKEVKALTGKKSTT